MDAKLFAAILLVVSAAGVSFIAPAGAAADPIYNNSSVDVNDDRWMDNNTDVTISNVSTMVGRVGTFVIGDVKGSAGAGPIVGGIIFGFFAVGMTGASRSGIVAGSVIGVATAATLSQGAGLVPVWVYGLVMIVVSLIAATIYIQMFR